MKHLSFLILLLMTIAVSAQNDTNNYYWVEFANKKGTPYTIDKPDQYLGQRALERRQRLGISIDSTDLPVNPKYLKEIAKKGAKIHNVSKWMNGTTVIATPEQAERLQQLDFVTSVNLYSRRAAQVDTTTNKYSAGRDTNTINYKDYDSNYYSLGYPQIKQLGGIRLHQQGYEGQGVMIGVCDGGFPGVDTLSVFASLRNEGRIVDTRDFVAHRTSVYCANDHGTMVLSTMAANIPGRYVGTAPKADYVLCITEDTWTESPIEELNWVSAAEYLDSLGVDIINSSLGYQGFDDTALRHRYEDLNGTTAIMSRGAEIAASRGILCVNSAGNEGRNGEHSLSVPADAEHILSVGAVWSNGTIAGFSSYGATYDHRVKPDVCAMGVMAYVASPLGGYLRANGTSFSSPIMAGMMACLRQAAPEASVADLCRAVRMAGNYADRVNNRYGYGIPDCGRALMSLKRPMSRITHKNANQKFKLSEGKLKKDGSKPNNDVLKQVRKKGIEDGNK
ncbi:MAG: S8 family serine peptidase [Bacteroidales bacterium]|nr:S8 family serine peptidase [Bacteroidales bacterium]